MKNGYYWARWNGFEGAHPSQVEPFIVQVDAGFARVSFFGSDDDYTLGRFEKLAIFLSGPLHPLDCEELGVWRELEKDYRTRGMASSGTILDAIDAIRARKKLGGISRS
jgi:hypothetical protein